MRAVTVLDGQGFIKLIAAGAYFLKKYRVLLNDLNVFPVTDGDTGSNLYVTARSALLAAGRARGKSLGEIATAAAGGALLGARGNSGVIFSQMLRGFADAVRSPRVVTSSEVAPALQRAVAEARAALLDPVEGTIISVAAAAADEAALAGTHANDLYELGEAIVRAAGDALERTPQQLAILRDAGVVDAGGAGLLYFLEAILRFGSGTRARATSYPRHAHRTRAFIERQDVSSNKYCTEFVLSEASIEPHALKTHLTPHGDSLLVAGARPTLRIHIHTDIPERVQSIAAEHGTVDRVKIDDMQQQHRVLLAQRPKRALSFVVVVPGSGFERIARELGAAETIVTQEKKPNREEIADAIAACNSDVVVVLPDDPNTNVLAEEAAAATNGSAVIVLPPYGAAASLAVLVEFGGRMEAGPVPSRIELDAAATRVRAATIGADLLTNGAPEQVLGDVALRLGAVSGGLVTLYYGGTQEERDAENLTNALRERMPKVEFEWFYGGQRTSEYVVAFER
ncbi:MAG TPA: DAK2 domain-containing protein [Candidatus Baltobacteraceae bacterium]|jgi:hypothetical protein